jgi:hypothetical protein
MAIPVIHQGIRFRSTLEARWATVLAALGMPWAYEPSRFDLPSGVYVPDFLVYPETSHGFWIEVKGPWPDARETIVASEINLYVAPLIILSGDLPRRCTEGTAWWFDTTSRQWSMIPPTVAVNRVLTALGAPATREGTWEQAYHEARHAVYERAPAGVHRGK